MNNFIKRLFVAVLLSPIILFTIYYGGMYFNILIILLIIFGFYEIFLLKKFYIKLTLLIIFIFFIFALYKLRYSHDNYGVYYLFFCILVTWFSDTGGYIFGKIFKGKKINIISPNKTFSGFFGALLMPQILTLCSYSEKIIILDIQKNIYIYVLMLSLISIIGDLFFSYIKRISNIKDYSNLIPGHGGLFDRIDSLIFVIITFFLII